MPLFRRQPSVDQEQQRQRQADAEASLESLTRGGLPLQAQRRLDALKQDPRHLFSSDLSVSEFALVDNVGVDPITQVMGSAFYHVGWSGLFTNMMASQELATISQAHRNARGLALGRLREEAERVGADAVVGVRLKRAAFEWASNMIEYTAIGTAVKVRGHRGAEVPALTDLSGQEFWKLLQAGYWPVGIAGGDCVFYQIASWATRSLNWFTGGFANQELQDYTAGLITARQLAAGDMADEGKRMHASGIVGVTIQQHQSEYEVEAYGGRRTDMIFTFHLLGTAIVRFAGEEQHGRPVTMAADLNSKPKTVDRTP
ncbi:MAG TPA: heavy metal-binding domain-containing protein [Chloroflexota bacterium]|nr:heavy metal-binding domain-containing protein [Chloroflexota bacterium]